MLSINDFVLIRGVEVLGAGLIFADRISNFFFSSLCAQPLVQLQQATTNSNQQQQEQQQQEKLET